MLIPAHSCVSVPLLTSPAIPSCSCLPLLCSPCRWRMMGAPRTRSSKTPRMSGEPSAKWRWGRERRRVMSPCIDLRGRNMRGNIPGNMGVGAETWDNSHHHGVLWTIFSKPVHVCILQQPAFGWAGSGRLVSCMCSSVLCSAAPLTMALIITGLPTSFVCFTSSVPHPCPSHPLQAGEGKDLKRRRDPLAEDTAEFSRWAVVPFI